MERHIQTIGILTSGGDAPGMNAAIRAVTRTARFHSINVIGVVRGYQGLIDKEFLKFTSSSVSNTIQRGGTILKTARSQEFMTPEGRRKAYDNMVEAGIDALIVIGGNGSLTGAQLFAREYDIPVIGLPGTIDNDLYGTDSTIGYDSALNTIVECVDKIRDTANSHDRIFFIEVKGAMPASSHRTAPSPRAPKPPSSRRDRPTWTSSRNSSSGASASPRTAPSSSCPKPIRTGSAARSIMPSA